MNTRIILFLWAFVISFNLQGADEENQQDKKPIVVASQQIQFNLENNKGAEDHENSDFRKKIENEIANPAIEYDLQSAARWRDWWKKASGALETFSKLSFGSSGLIAFASGYWKEDTSLSFLAGAFSLGAFTLHSLSSYAIQNSNRETEKINMYFKTLGIQQALPMLEETNSSSNLKNKKTNK